MSNNHSHRRPLSDLRPEPRPYSSSDPCHTSSEHHQAPQDFSSSYLSSSRAQWSQDSAFNVLSSCGLEPADLALLAKLPEDVLTVESLPQVLKQLKGKRDIVEPSSSAYPHSSAYQPAVSSSAGDCNLPCSQPLQHLRSQVIPSPLLPDLDRWGHPRTCSPLSPASSSSYVVDYHHQPGSSECGKTGGASPVGSQDRASFSSAAGSEKTRLFELGSADYGSASPEDLRLKTRGSQRESFPRRSSQNAASIPSKKEALDFHGTTPPIYPYSCALCEVTVMSEQVSTPVLLCGTRLVQGQAFCSLMEGFPLQEGLRAAEAWW